MFWVNLQMAQAGKKHQFTAEIWCPNHLEIWRNGLKLHPTGTSTKYDTVHLFNNRVRTIAEGKNSWSGAESSSCTKAEPCRATTANSDSFLGCMSGSQVGTVLSLYYPTTMYSHRRERKVIRITRKKIINITCKKRLHGEGFLVFVFCWCLFLRGKIESNILIYWVTKHYPYPQYKEIEKTQVRY